jgi:hypothetical protein
MADFCRAHSFEVWGFDARDLAGLTSEEETKNGVYAKALCESCGEYVMVDHRGIAVTGPTVKEKTE